MAGSADFLLPLQADPLQGALGHLYVLDGVTWILAPTDGRPTWIKALGSPEEATDANSAKLTHSINATKMA